MKIKMEKTKVKSILPKPSPLVSTTSTPPPLLPLTTSAAKRKSQSSSAAERKKQRKSVPMIAGSSTGGATSNTPANFRRSSSPAPGMNSPHTSRPLSAVSQPEMYNYGNTIDNNNNHNDVSDSEDTPSKGKSSSKQTGHRPVTSCTFCRQHKIKCNASDNYPSPCQRCQRMGLKCEIDPQFRPKKGSQIQSLKSDVDELKAKIEMLTKNESLLTQALTQHNLNYMSQQQQSQSQPQSVHQSSVNVTPVTDSSGSPQTMYQGNVVFSLPSITTIMQPQAPLAPENTDNYSPSTVHTTSPQDHYTLPAPSVQPPQQDYVPISEFILGDVKLPLSKANELHDRFIKQYLQFMPIITSNSATELYHKSQLLFWTIICISSLGEPDSTLYMSLASLIKQLAIETCWIKTPRSTHVIQALILLSIWPLPNEKVLDDCSYRFIGLAKNLSLQLGLHRGGEFIQEFSRNQVSLGPDAEKWRTRSWLAIFFCEQFWSSLLGLPPSINTTDYLLENARVDKSLPKDFRCLISLSIFQCKLVNVMGISVTRPDGLLEPSNRAGSLNLLDRELERLRFKLQFKEGSAIEVYYLYIKLMICCFAFLPGTPIEDQVNYVGSGYLASTRIITIVSNMTNEISLIELPIYVRQAMNYSVLLLFKLHLSRYLIDKYLDSVRQSIVTVHRLLRNTLKSWKDLQNDMTRTAKVLENLNIVLYKYPDVFISNENEQDDNTSIITRMRSHLTASLFYDLVWCVHEGRRRTLLDKNSEAATPKATAVDRKYLPLPLPFYNQISKDDFTTKKVTTPNGTTITTLVPTDKAMSQAREQATVMNKPIEINGIPLAMLEATGSSRDTAFVRPQQDIEERNVPKVQEQQQQQQPQQAPGQQPQQQQQQLPLPMSALQQQQLRQPQPDHNMLQPLPTINSPFLPQSPAPGMSLGQQQPPHQQFMGSIDDINHTMFMNNSASTDVQQPLHPPHMTGGDTPFDQFDNFFQQQSNGWLNNDNYQDNDDFLGWFDVNSMNEQ
ncbi:Transcriptional regulatory protein SEF1 [Spathaspora sp. JA1]|nr:Transcriptional regulatory protein SEF1 [Spathaspora sp. JA1]